MTTELHPEMAKNILSRGTQSNRVAELNNYVIDRGSRIISMAIRKDLFPSNPIDTEPITDNEHISSDDNQYFQYPPTTYINFEYKPYVKFVCAHFEVGGDYQKCAQYEYKAVKTIKEAKYRDRQLTCVRCANNTTRVEKGHKLTYDNFVQSLEERMFKMRDPAKNYVDASTKMLIECPAGHMFAKNFAGWNQLIREGEERRLKRKDREDHDNGDETEQHFCRQCANDEMCLDIDIVSAKFDECGKILLSTKYVNNKTPLEYVCQCGNIAHGTYTNVISLGRSCGKCFPSGKPKVNFDYIKKFAADNNCKLLSEPSEYNSQKSQLRFTCACGENFMCCWKEFRFHRQTCGLVKCSLRRREDTNIKKYGEKNVMDVPEIKQKWKDSIIEKYGSMQKFMETTWEKSIQTCTKKYGVPHLYYLEKFRNCYKPKTVVLPKTKRHVKCQGYEDIAIQTLCQDPDFDEGDLVVGDDCPAIPYVYMNKDAKYFPDIYLKSKRVLIEIKSMFTLHMQYERNLLKFKAADELYDFYIWVYDTATSQPKILRYADLANEHPPLCDDYIKTEIERPLTSHEKYLLENGEATTYEDKFIQSILQNGLFPAPTFVYCGAKKQCDIQCRYGHIFKKSWDMWKLDTKGCERCKQVDKYIVDRQAYINLCPKLGLSFTSMVQNIGKIGYSVTVECDNCKLTDVIASTALDRRTSQGCTTCCKHIKLPKLE